MPGVILPDAPPLGANSPGVHFLETLLNNAYVDENGNNRYPFIVPPDSHAAVGPNHIVTIVNGTLRIFEISSGNLVRNFRLGSLLGTGNPATATVDGNGNTTPANTSTAFFAPLTPANRLFDPRVVYDQMAQRFIIIALERVDAPSPTASRILIAVSPASDPTVTNWQFRAVNA